MHYPSPSFSLGLLFICRKIQINRKLLKVKHIKEGIRCTMTRA